MILRCSTILLFATMTFCMVFSADDVTLQGKLVIEGKGPVLQTKEKPVPLASNDHNLAATLSDPRISGRELKMEGKFRNDGVFEVHRFFVVRSGSLYRLIYFCDT